MSILEAVGVVASLLVSPILVLIYIAVAFMLSLAMAIGYIDDLIWPRFIPPVIAFVGAVFYVWASSNFVMTSWTPIGGS